MSKQQLNYIIESIKLLRYRLIKHEANETQARNAASHRLWIVIDVLALRISSSSAPSVVQKQLRFWCALNCCEKVKVWCCVNSPTIVQRSNGLAWLRAEFKASTQCKCFLTNHNPRIASPYQTAHRWSFNWECSADDARCAQKREFSFYFSHISPSPHFLMTLDSFQYHHQQRCLHISIPTSQLHLQ